MCTHTYQHVHNDVAGRDNCGSLNYRGVKRLGVFNINGNSKSTMMTESSVWKLPVASIPG